MLPKFCSEVRSAEILPEFLKISRKSMKINLQMSMNFRGAGKNPAPNPRRNPASIHWTLANEIIRFMLFHREPPAPRGTNKMKSSRPIHLSKRLRVLLESYHGTAYRTRQSWRTIETKFQLKVHSIHWTLANDIERFIKAFPQIAGCTARHNKKKSSRPILWKTQCPALKTQGAS